MSSIRLGCYICSQLLPNLDLEAFIKSEQERRGLTEFGLLFFEDDQASLVILIEIHQHAAGERASSSKSQSHSLRDSRDSQSRVVGTFRSQPFRCEVIRLWTPFETIKAGRRTSSSNTFDLTRRWPDECRDWHPRCNMKDDHIEDLPSRLIHVGTASSPVLHLRLAIRSTEEAHTQR